jgi:hypothetical protein
VSRLTRSPHLGPALGALALVVAAVALVVTLTRGDPKAPDLAKRIVYVSNVTGKDDTGEGDQGRLPARHRAPRGRIGRAARQ